MNDGVGKLQRAIANQSTHMIVVGVCQQNVRNLFGSHAGSAQLLQQLTPEALREQLARSGIHEVEPSTELEQENVNRDFHRIGDEPLLKQTIGPLVGGVAQ